MRRLPVRLWPSRRMPPGPGADQHNPKIRAVTLATASRNAEIGHSSRRPRSGPGGLKHARHLRRRHRPRVQHCEHDSTRRMGVDLRQPISPAEQRLEGRFPHVAGRHQREDQRQGRVSLHGEPRADQPAGPGRHSDGRGLRSRYHQRRQGHHDSYFGSGFAVLSVARRQARIRDYCQAERFRSFRQRSRTISWAPPGIASAIPRWTLRPATWLSFSASASGRRTPRSRREGVFRSRADHPAILPLHQWRPVTPTFVGLSSAGLYQINLIVPPGIGQGDVPIQAFVGGLANPKESVDFAPGFNGTTVCASPGGGGDGGGGGGVAIGDGGGVGDGGGDGWATADGGGVGDGGGR